MTLSQINLQGIQKSFEDVHIDLKIYWLSWNLIFWIIFLTYIRCIVKLAKEIVESLHQLANGQGRRHFGKLADVSK